MNQASTRELTAADFRQSVFGNDNVFVYFLGAAVCAARSVRADV